MVQYTRPFRLFAFLLLTLVISTPLACHGPREFEFRQIEEMKIEKAGFGKSVLALRIQYYNPNPFRVSLKSIKADVSLENKFLGTLVMDTLIMVPASADFRIPARLEVDMKTIYSSGLSVLLNRDMLVSVNGVARVGKSGIFTNVPFSYAAKQKLDLTGF